MSDQLHKPEKIARRIRIAEQVMEDANKMLRETGQVDLALKARWVIIELQTLCTEIERSGNDTQTFSRRKAA